MDGVEEVLERYFKSVQEFNRCLAKTYDPKKFEASVMRIVELMNMDTSLLSSMYDEDGRDISALIEEMEEDSYEDHIR